MAEKIINKDGRTFVLITPQDSAKANIKLFQLERTKEVVTAMSEFITWFGKNYDDLEWDEQFHDKLSKVLDKIIILRDLSALDNDDLVLMAKLRKEVK